MIQTDKFTNIKDDRIAVELKGKDVVKDNKLRFVTIINETDELNFNLPFNQLYNLTSNKKLNYSSYSDIATYGISDETQVEKQKIFLNIKADAAVLLIKFEIDKTNSNYSGSYNDICLHLDNLSSSGYLLKEELTTIGSKTSVILKNESSVCVYPSENISSSVVLNILGKSTSLAESNITDFKRFRMYKFKVRINEISPNNIKAYIEWSDNPFGNNDIEIDL